TISDTGVGMSEKVKERIFEPFFTTKEKGHGTGLGLSMVYGVIKNHGGYIDVESYPGMGTTFSIYIPANHKVKKSKEITPIEEIIHGKGTILVIDDEEVVRDVLKDMLESIGYNVLTAENGKKGLNIYKSNIDIDLVILDLIMPVMSGKETFQELKKINKNVKVLIATGYAKEEHLKEVLEQGALGVIQKPFTLERLSAKINKIITP
ncbi:MAG: response regulator, partial [Deltaproteobacteria bacterium]|nr:response regulator [Deltaproteobacteria bacterium]